MMQLSNLPLAPLAAVDDARHHQFSQNHRMKMLLLSLLALPAKCAAAPLCSHASAAEFSV